MEIKLENVSYYDHEIIKGDCLNSPHKIHKYLDNCSATITSGTLVGIIGSPSETKNLLQLISLRNLSGQVLGHIQHDNSIRKIGTSCYRDIAYISSTSSANCQYFHYLTITNYLLWSIQLRSILSSLSEYTNRVYEICHLLDLNGSLHIHELEEGQLFLLSLATELVTNPTLICIESPIDNLDEYSSILIIQTLQKIAHRFNTSTTIIFTALGPSSTIYSYLDQIIIFYINKILYSSKGFFEKDIFHHRPLGFNRGGQVSSHQTTPMKTPPPPAPPSPLSSSSHLHETTISSSTFDYCYQTFELISREFKRSGYGTKLFYLSPDLLRTVSKDVEIVHFLIADPHQSNTLLESYIDRIYSREMHEKREKLEGILQRYIQLIVTKCIEYNSEQRKHESEKSHEESVLDSPHTPTKIKTLSSPSTPSGKTPSRQRRLAPSMIVKSSNPFFSEVRILTQRAWASATTNHTSVTITICQYLLSGILLGLFAYKAGKKSSYANANDDLSIPDDDTWINDDSFSITSTLFFLLIIQIYIHLYTVPYHISHLNLLRNEISSSVYHPLSAYATLQLFHWSVHFIGSMIISTLIYFMLHLSFDSSLHLFYYYVSILLYIYTSLSLLTFLCLYIPSSSSSSSSSTRTTYVYLLISSCILLLSGYIQPLSNLSYPLRVLTRLSYGRYTFQLLMILCYGETKSGEWYLERYSFDNTNESTLSHCIFNLFLWFLALQIAIIWGLYPFQSRVLYTQALGYFGKDGLPQSSSRSESSNESKTINRLLHNDHSNQQNHERYLIDTTYHTPSSPAAYGINNVSYPSGFQPVLHSVTVVPLDHSKQTFLQFNNINFYLKNRHGSSSFYFSSSSSTSTATQSLSLLKQTFPSIASSWKPPPTDNSSTSIANDPNYELLLKNLSGECHPYQLWCILDSEDDSSTLTVLLQLLSGISKSYGITTGKITVNGIIDMIQDTQQPFENLVYICKGDSPNHRYLTVREVLYYQILLRRKNQKSFEGCIRYFDLFFQQSSSHRGNGGGTSSANDPYILEDIAINDQVNTILQLFQLEEISEIQLLIGDSSNPHISPSQLRCLTIAMESIHSPGIYLLQDPFDGLDWYHTERVMRVLRALTDGGRCVICAISNPTERMFSYFNRLMLLHKGLLLYSGEINEVKNHFDGIGYQSSPGQTLLDYLYDICHGKALLTSLASPSQHHLSPHTTTTTTATRKRAPSSLLTPEDLANIRHSMDGYTSSLSPITSVRNTLSSRKSDHGERLTSTSSDGIHAIMSSQFVIEDNTPVGESAEMENIPVPCGPVIVRTVPLVLPSARVTLYRRCISAFRNRRMIALYWMRSFLISIILGLVWYDTDASDVQAKLLLATTAYLYIVGCLADLLEGTHRRQTDYLRERISVAQTAQAYWWSDGTPVLIHSLMNAILLTTPLYLLSGYRTGSGHFLCFAFLLYISIYCNVGLMYLISALTKRASISRIIYLGLLIPLQLLFCGSLIYLSTYPPWLRWGAYLNPMHYYLTAVFINEFHDNSATFSSSSSHHYHQLKSQYGYQTSLIQSIFLLILLGYLYKMLWLFSLKYREIWVISTLPLKRVYRAAKKKMKKLMKASIRLSKKHLYTENEENEDDGYVLDNSTESYDEWRSDDEDKDKQEKEKEKEKIKEKKKKNRQNLNEEMYVREDGLLLFGVMQQPPTTSTIPAPSSSSISSSASIASSASIQTSHHSVLSALYRPEYIQTTSSGAIPAGASSSSSLTGGGLNTNSSSPNTAHRTSSTSKNRIVVSKSQRATNGNSNGGQEGSADNLHSSLRI